MLRSLIAVLMIFCLPIAADAKSNDKKRAEIQKMANKTLAQLYKEESRAKAEVANAKGYAVFSNIGINVVFLSAGGGKGMVHNNGTGENTYMKMGSAGVGLGLGVKDFRAVFIFNTVKAMDDFTDKGWDFSGQADAAAASGDKGGEGSVAGTVMPGTKIYQITKNGLALQATLQGTKYWKNKKLNKK